MTTHGCDVDVSPNIVYMYILLLPAELLMSAGRDLELGVLCADFQRILSTGHTVRL